MHTNATSATPRLALVNLVGLPKMRSLEKRFGLFANVALQLHDAAVIRVLPQTYQKWNNIWKLETKQQCGPKARTYTKCSSSVIQKHIIHVKCEQRASCSWHGWIKNACVSLMSTPLVFESLLQGPQNPGLRCTGSSTRMGLVRWEIMGSGSNINLTRSWQLQCS